MSRLRLLLGLLLAVTITVTVGASWLHRQWQNADEERLHLAAQLDVAMSQRQGAIEQRAAAERERLIAERQRQDALQQRSAAERQRLNAEQQRLEALSQRSAAERERLNAEQQRQEAVAQRSVAERERRNAEQQRQEAVQQRTVAEQLRLLDVGQKLATEVSRTLQQGDRAIGTLLALQAYRLTIENGGSPADPEIFEALRQAKFSIALAGHVLLGHEDEVRAVAFLDNESLVSAADDGSLRFWTLDGSAANRVLYRSPQRLQALSADRRGHFVVGGSEGSLLLWTMGDTPQYIRLDAQRDISDVAFSSSEQIAVGHLDGRVSFWPKPDVAPLSAPAKSNAAAHAQPIAVFGSAPMLAWAGYDGGVHLWNTSTPDRQPQIIGKSLGRVTALAVDVEGNQILAGTLGGDIAIWDLDDLSAPFHKLVGHASQITSLAVAAGGRLASGSLDNTIRLWNLARTDLPPVTIDHGAWVWSVVFAPDGKMIASAGADRAVRLWPTSAPAMADTLCGAMRRNLSVTEWQEYVGDDIPYQRTCDHLPEASHAQLD
ncbi:MAG: hypothetical protein HOM68_27860 [Gemmatimonadetes bacterium]|jgi:hypothetical protein|nr:hypothetical protein [Gemmatimonadota bacterium]MBT5146046.1 hypothetical protein [Gemmatimonadota bacterium]MBT5591875.1 hypothetical protein [Gemmatimonadota bacterium]MBT5961550.1 hypothetical protein [Gemmatimonadota bacterium]MBT6630448.1 hypothetical protein [Gemmatimonadota bacterium]